MTSYARDARATLDGARLRPDNTLARRPLDSAKRMTELADSMAIAAVGGALDDSGETETCSKTSPTIRRRSHARCALPKPTSAAWSISRAAAPT
ncbi:hypothetical protein BVI1335_1230010 [Burkholderia vietnamiensis]|nr:hypothetical protein BVI1335_1230010 [Burkholderia vietnamiensis]